jgi:hypothetical protein
MSAKRVRLPLFCLLLFVFVAPLMMTNPFPPSEDDDSLELESSHTESSNGPWYTNVEIAGDGDDDWWWYNETDQSWIHRTADTDVWSREYVAEYWYVGQLRFQLNIPASAHIDSAILHFYETYDSGTKIYNAYRINEANCTPDLESRGTSPQINYSTTVEFTADGVDPEWQSFDIGLLIQDQVNLPTWTEGDYFGMRFNDSQKIEGGDHWRFEDYQDAGTNHAYLNVTWYNSTPSPTWLDNYAYRRSHVLEQTAGAGVDHTVPIVVNLTAGTDSGNTSYLDWKSQINMNDIRFTNATHYELDFWREEWYYNNTETVHFSDRGANFAWYSAGYPTAYYYENRTYVAFQSSNYEPMVCYYDHENETWSPDYQVGTNPMSATDDDHGVPALWVSNQGYIHIIYGCHNTPAEHVVSNEPYRLDAGWTELDFDLTDPTYPNIIYDPVNDVVHFVARDTGGYPWGLIYTNSTDNGQTWSDEQMVISTPSGVTCMVYKGGAVLDPVDPEIIHFVWATYNSSDDPDDQDIRYAYMNSTTGELFNYTDDSFGTQIDRYELWRDCLVWEQNNHVYQPLMKFDSEGDPYIAVVYVVSSPASGRNSTMLWYNSTTSTWTKCTPDISHHTTFFGGGCDIIVHDDDNVTAFVSDNAGDMSRYTWDGSTWTFEEYCYTDEQASDQDFYFLGHSQVPINYNDTIQVVFNGAAYGGKHTPLYAWGDSGLVNRSNVIAATFWVKVDGNLSDSDQTIYIYYGDYDIDTYSTGSWFSTSDSPQVTHGSWGTEEYRTVNETTSGYGQSSFRESLSNNYMLCPDNETHGYYFVEDGVSLSDWTYNDTAPSTNGDYMQLDVLNDGKPDEFVCNDTSMTAGYYYLDFWAASNVTTTSSISIVVYEQDGAQGSSTDLGSFTLSTYMTQRIKGYQVAHAVESLMIKGVATVSDTRFSFDYIRWSNETGWQHDGSTTWGVQVSGAGASVSSDGDYISLINSGGAMGMFDFYIDGFTTYNACQRSDYYPFVEVNFHTDDGDEWYYLYVYRAGSGYKGIRNTITNMAVDKNWIILPAGGMASNVPVRDFRIQFSGTKTIRLDYIKTYYILNFTIDDSSNGITAVEGAAWVEDGSLVIHDDVHQGLELNYDVNPSMNLDLDEYQYVEVNASKSFKTHYSPFSAYIAGQWRDWNESQMIYLQDMATGSFTDFQINAYSGGRIYSIRFGNLTTGGGGIEGSVPTNDQTPSCTNLDDSTYMYSQYKDYIVAANASDADGFSNLDYLEVTLYDNARGTPYWTVRFDEDTATFSEQSDTNNIITLNTGSCTNTSSGNTLNITILFTIHWNHSDIIDSDVKQYVTDSDANSDTDFYEVDWDVESDVVTTFSLSDGSGTIDRGDINGIDSITASGTATYQGSSINPASDEVDVWVNCTDIAGSPWSDTTLSSGAWSVTVDSDDVVGLDTYWAYVVVEGEGQDGTQVNGTTVSDTYIADRLVIDMQADDETPINNLQVNFTLTVTYEYDSASCSTYTIQIDRNATNWYVFTDANKSLFNDTNSDTTYQYNATTTGEGVSETTHGLTVFTTNTETVTWSVGNNVPVNSSSPSLTNADDSTYMYSRYDFYIITSNCTDGDGYTDIDQVLLLLWDNGQSTNYWTLKFDQDTSQFSVVNGSGYLSLAAWSSYTESGDNLDITWVIKVDWDHPDLNDIDTKQFVNDTDDASDVDWYESNWDVETRLDYSVAPYLSDDRGNINDDIDGYGTVIYYGSGDDYPLANETDVWISHDVSGTYSGNVDGVGQFAITIIGTSSSVRLNTYTFKVVVQDDGSGGTDLYYTTSATDTFISDRIQVQTTTVDDSRVSVEAQPEIRVTLWLDYDDTWLGAGDFVVLGDISMSWDAVNSWWELKRSWDYVVAKTFWVNSSTETTYGVTEVDLNGQSVEVIWDRIKIMTTSTASARVDKNTSATILVTATLEYDGHVLGSEDTLYMNNTQMSWSGSVFTYDTSIIDTVSEHLFFVNATGAWEATYGIAMTNLNGKSVAVIWDEVIVTSTTSSHENRTVGQYVTIYAVINFTYDGLEITDGTIRIAHDEPTQYHTMSYSGGAWEVQITSSTTGNLTFYVYDVVSSPYSITELNLNDKNVTVEFTAAATAWTGNPPGGGDDDTPRGPVFTVRVPTAVIVFTGVGLAAYAAYSPAIRAWFKRRLGRKGR